MGNKEGGTTSILGTFESAVCVRIESRIELGVEIRIESYRRTTFCRGAHGEMTAKNSSIPSRNKKSNLKFFCDGQISTDRQNQLLTIIDSWLGAEIIAIPTKNTDIDPWISLWEDPANCRIDQHRLSPVLRPVIKIIRLTTMRSDDFVQW